MATTTHRPLSREQLIWDHYCFRHETTPRAQCPDCPDALPQATWPLSDSASTVLGQMLAPTATDDRLYRLALYILAYCVTIVCVTAVLVTYYSH